ncbi:urea amidolyase associated protein UAAP1 [Sulfuricurvum sp.]|uniref:urea amidolyase associated protein UAAP1 n=1 Tax=Sulfuricurvum sp. TaxID=2025608 RepID=UPI0026224E5C|nr:urea amidolyase associated protein UAAP1 [Sulfuricurvum sp.]MDD2265491.1 DUF1989 domain-containing protein [Sulfuricurvum sp.]MDD2783401.1 DUF1989 domain-containing protein [Sulfuricurvum sp.]
MSKNMKPLLPETVLFDEVLVGGGRWSKIIRKGQVLRIVNTEATSGLSALFYNVHERTERYNAADTVKIQYNAYLKEGKALYSDMGRVLMSIVADSCETHDTVCGYTMAADVEKLCGIGNYQTKRNCYYKNDFDNFLVELGKYGMGRRDIMPCLNLFSDARIGEGGELIYREDTVPAGSFIELRAEMDVLVILSNTVHVLSTNQSYDVKPVNLIVYQGEEAAADDMCVIDSERSERAFVNTKNYMKQFIQGGRNV